MANYNYIELTGTITPDTSTLLNDVQNEFKDAFGADLNVNPETPQGVLITGEVSSRSSVLANNAAVANQINPNLAGGIFLDAIMALTGSERQPETYSKVVATVGGVIGTVLPQGVTAKTSNGDIFASDQTVTIGATTTLVGFTAVEAGPILCLPNTLTQIVNGPIGWETVTNTLAATLGTVTQSDIAARAFRSNTLALQGNGLAEAITSGLYATPNVMSLTFRENWNNDVRVIDGITMQPHSMYACVDGGTDFDVANTIRNKKDGGCDFTNGAGTPVSVIVIDPFSGQAITILFDRPLLIPVVARVTVSADSSIADPQSAVKAAIMDYVNGALDGEAGFTIGTSVSCFELAGAINTEFPKIFVHNVETSLASMINYSNAEIPITLYQKATISENDIIVVIV